METAVRQEDLYFIYYSKDGGISYDKFDFPMTISDAYPFAQKKWAKYKVLHAFQMDEINTLHT